MIRLILISNVRCWKNAQQVDHTWGKAHTAPVPALFFLSCYSILAHLLPFTRRTWLGLLRLCVTRTETAPKAHFDPVKKELYPFFFFKSKGQIEAKIATKAQEIQTLCFYLDERIANYSMRMNFVFLRAHFGIPRRSSRYNYCMTSKVLTF